MEDLEEKCLEVEQRRRAEVESCQKEYERLRKETHILKEEKQMMGGKVRDMEHEMMEVRVKSGTTNDEHDMMVNEFRKI